MALVERSEFLVETIEFQTMEFTEQLLDYIPISWTTPEARQRNGKLYTILYTIAKIFTILQINIDSIKAQFRLATATGKHLDAIGRDFFGLSDSIVYLSRTAGESDSSYRIRLQTELLTSKATPKAIIEAVQRLTGGTVSFFEPFNAASAVCWTGQFNSQYPPVGFGCYGSTTLNQFIPVLRNDGSTPGSTSPNVGVGAMGDANVKFTFILSVLSNPNQVANATIVTMIDRIRPAGVRAIIRGGL